MDNYFWENVKTLLKEKGITQAEFAKDCDITVNTFVGWISKNRSPDLDIAVMIARKLNTSVEFLVTGEKTEGVILSQEDNNLLNEYHSLPEVFREIIKTQIKEYSKYKGMFISKSALD